MTTPTGNHFRYKILMALYVLLLLQLFSGQLTLEWTRWSIRTDLNYNFDVSSVYERASVIRNETASLAPSSSFFEAIEKKPQERLFPRWDDDGGIPLRPLLDFIHGVAADTESTVESDTLRGMFPETVYVVDGRGVWTSRRIRQRTTKVFVGDRLRPTELVAKLAHSILLPVTLENAKNGTDEAVNSTSITTWPNLQRAVSSGGFPYIAWYGDFRSCNYLNWKRRNHSIPLFTTCAHINCTHAFPLPTYKTIQGSQDSPKQWDAVLSDAEAKYPWQSKIRKVVWRGSLTGDIDNYQNPRWRLCKLVTDQPSDLFDIGLAKIPPRHAGVKLDLSVVGGLVESISPMTEFQRYQAILDTDGNSWSSRFGALLCYNSVVLKVEPHYVDYFHFKYLKPWKHFIPVRYDLSDLHEQAAFATDPRNTKTVRGIVAAANEWCRTHMVKDAIARDFLDVWEHYVGWLDRADPHWTDEWLREKERLFGTASTAQFEMVKL